MFNELQQLSPSPTRPPQIQSPQSQNTGVPQSRVAASQTVTSQNMTPHAAAQTPSIPHSISQTPPTPTSPTTSATPTTQTAQTTPSSSSNQAYNQAQVVELLRLLPNTATRQQSEEQKQLLIHLIQQTQQMEGMPTSLFALKKNIDQLLETIPNQATPVSSDQLEMIKEMLTYQPLIIHALIDIKNNQNSSRIQKLFGWKIPDWKWKDKAERWAKPMAKPLGGILLIALTGAILVGIFRMGELNQNLNLLNSNLENPTRRTTK